MKKRPSIKMHPEKGFVCIPLTQGKRTIIDVSDAEIAARHTWHAVRHRHTWYAATKVRRPDGKQTTLYLHRLIANSDREVDHRNHNGLDNRRLNLRPCSHAMNMRNRARAQPHNTSGFIGVSYRPDKRKWAARLTHQGRHLSLGHYDTPEAAARARDAAAYRQYGEFAGLNFPREVNS